MQGYGWNVKPERKTILMLHFRCCNDHAWSPRFMQSNQPRWLLLYLLAHHSMSEKPKQKSFQPFSLIKCYHIDLYYFISDNKRSKPLHYLECVYNVLNSYTDRLLLISNSVCIRVFLHVVLSAILPRSMLKNRMEYISLKFVQNVLGKWSQLDLLHTYVKHTLTRRDVESKASKKKSEALPRHDYSDCYVLKSPFLALSFSLKWKICGFGWKKCYLVVCNVNYGQVSSYLINYPKFIFVCETDKFWTSIKVN